ncbi:MAG: CoA transferase, partial [Acidimicrobiales bacterium]
LLAAIAITIALYHRDRTGEGQAVSTSIVNAGLLHTSYAWIHSDGTPGDWGQVDGGQFGLSPYYRLYQCALGEWVFLAAVTSEARARLRTLLPGEPTGDDPESVADWLGSYFLDARASEAFAVLDDGDVPIEVVDEYFCRNLFDDPDARRLQLVSETHSSAVGRFEDAGLLVNISPSEPVVQRGPCASGEHTREILRELGYSAADVEAMEEGRAVLDGSK